MQFNQRGRHTLHILKLLILMLCFFMPLSFVQKTKAQEDPRCSTNVKASINAEVNRALALRQNTFKQYYPAPPALSQITNTPCKARELQNIGSRFSSAISQYTSQGDNYVSGLSGPLNLRPNVGSIAGKMVDGSFKTNYSKYVLQGDFGGAANAAFQDYANEQLSGLLTSLGLEDSPLNNALCGIMVDAVLKFALCELPAFNLGGITGPSWNIPGCAGDALITSINQANYDIPLNQKAYAPQGGVYQNSTKSRAAISPDLPWAKR
jgi:hypothetical protein